MPKYYIDDIEFGRMAVTEKPQAHSIIFHWKNGKINITAPSGFPKDGVIRNIDKVRERLREKIGTPRVFYPGEVIKCFRHNIIIGTHKMHKGTVIYGGNKKDLFINMHENTDFSNPDITAAISRCMELLMAKHAEEFLIPFAKSVIDELGIIDVKRFVIGRGKRKLGHCTQDKEIQLSHNLMFYPEELVRYVICHELAHLKYMNHGPEFHDLCNFYCNGDEEILNKQLKEFKTPLL